MRRGAEGEGRLKLSLIMSREEAKESISSKSMMAGALERASVEDGAQPRLALAPVLVEDLRPRDRYKVGPALVRHGPRQRSCPSRAVRRTNTLCAALC